MTSSREDSQHQPPPAAASPRGPRLHDVICQTRTLAAPGAAATAHVAGPDTNVDAQERLRGYREALAAELPGATEDVLPGDFTEESGYKAARETISRPRRPDAIFAGNDTMAIGCLSALTEAGLQVPQDMALAGFDDIPTARLVVPPLTTVRVKIADLGASVLDRLAAAIDQPTETTTLAETVSAELVVRASCGPRMDISERED